MPKRFLTPNPKLLVAMTFDDRSARLASAAKVLAGRAAASLRLTHVVEPILPTIAPQLLAVDSPMYEMTQHADLERVEKSKAKMHEVANGLGDQISIEEQVVIGPSVPTLLADAATSGAAMIICGAANESYRFLPAGFSTALGLMEHSPLPVMVIPSHAKVDYNKKRLSILIADDLTDRAAEAVNQGLEFARALGSCDVIHLHVDPNNYTQLKTEAEFWLRHNRAGSSTAQLEDWFENVEQRLQAALEKRAQEHMALLAEKDCKYQAIVKQSRHVADIVTKTADDIHADIIVIGRHQRIHWRPFSLGRLPFHLLLQQNRALLIASPE